LPRDRFVHEARFGRRLDDLVLAILVAIATREIALARHVEDERLQRNATLGLLDGGLWRRRENRMNRAHAEQFVDRRTNVFGAPALAEGIGELRARAVARL